MKHISFPSIEQFRNIIANVNRQYNFVGLDEQGEAIYNENRTKPILTFTGTVKLHGTCASVVYNEADGLWVQSRENIITPQNDNAGFAFFVSTKELIFIELIKRLANNYQINLNENSIMLSMEWAGKGIQKGVAINNIEKSAFIFAHAKVIPFDESQISYWVSTNVENLKSSENRIYNILDYKTYTIDIDFNAPQLAQNKIIDMTLEVENECPVGKAFGFSGIGEGLVFTHQTPDGIVYKFKSKGLKHAGASKVKTLKPVDDEKINKVISVVNEICKSWRLEQMLEKTFDFMNGGQMDVKQMGTFIKNVLNDILKEEIDVITAAGLIPKDINSKVSEVCRQFFFDKQNEAVGLT